MFFRRTKEVFKNYYRRIAAKDKLSGLSEEEMLRKIRESPKSIQKSVAGTLKKLEKYGVGLNEEN